MSVNLVSSGVAAAILASAVVLGVMHREKVDARSVQHGAATPVAVTSKETVVKPRPAFTHEKFEAMRYGMDVDAVKALLGGDETDSYTVYDKGVDGYTSPSLTVWYTWSNPDGSKIKAGFIGEKLVEKAEEAAK